MLAADNIARHSALSGQLDTSTSIPSLSYSCSSFSKTCLLKVSCRFSLVKLISSCSNSLPCSKFSKPFPPRVRRKEGKSRNQVGRRGGGEGKVTNCYAN